jgi:hypothetical protein
LKSLEESGEQVKKRRTSEENKSLEEDIPLESEVDIPLKEIKKHSHKTLRFYY